MSAPTDETRDVQAVLREALQAIELEREAVLQSFGRLVEQTLADLAKVRSAEIEALKGRLDALLTKFRQDFGTAHDPRPAGPANDPAAAFLAAVDGALELFDPASAAPSRADLVRAGLAAALRSMADGLERPAAPRPTAD